MAREEIAAKVAGFPELTRGDEATILDIARRLEHQPAIQDVISERAYQVFRFDEHNSQTLPSLDSYIGLAVTYLGGASCSYRNEKDTHEETMADKRTSLIKAAAVLLQAAHHIDEDSL